jgi:hypothetical protein
MRRLLKLGIALIVSCLWVGCGKPKELNGPQIVYAGLGVSNSIEVGMSFKQIGKNNSDLKIERLWDPNIPPWEKLFKKPRMIQAQIPSRGASLWGFSEAQTFGQLTFTCSNLPPTRLYFSTNEMTLSPMQTVSFAEIVQRMGPPKYSINVEPTTPLLGTLINAGQSVVWSNQNGCTLYYSAAGVFFHFQNGLLEQFSIARCRTDTNAVASSK